MQKRKYRKVNKLMILLLAILMCGTLTLQAFATEIKYDTGSTIEKSSTNNLDNASVEDGNILTEEVLTDEEDHVSSEEEKKEPDHSGKPIGTNGAGEELARDQKEQVEEETESEKISQGETGQEETSFAEIFQEELDLDELSGNCLVVFDPNDGKTGYGGFYKVTVPLNSIVSSQPKDPARDGYIFNGWYAYLDESGDPVHWDFENDTVTENTTLWADWENGCLVIFDPDDGKTGYNSFYKVTVPLNSIVSSQPKDPARDGYIFNGWYAYLDESGDPVHWDFENDTVTENTTLWADWENGCLVVFDPDNGKTGYNSFYKVMLPLNSTVTSQPKDPVRDGYIFNGWYAYLDESGDPVHWDFENDTVTENITLWASWDIDSGYIGGGNSEGNNDGNGGSNSGGNGGSISGGNSGSNGDGNGGGNGDGNGGGNGSESNNDTSDGDIEFVLTEDEDSFLGYHALDSLPKTGYSNFNRVLLWVICCTSALGIIVLTAYKQKFKLLKIKCQ
ncbi:putative repeat protein (TIGR02543 family) [Hungatella effluvii]|uniref:Putative repeat protein (TIGR02543 family) n=1 Tax=Hungatella effluvii TaxID=1096246 RepID=A0A2V3XY45_9FIRM|nr:InlB B-repeat-containing protein [Hungatella effluvii]PXX49229.1 putative repeat protein (TIGR02543 family) [Hungatella effluvii]